MRNGRESFLGSGNVLFLDLSDSLMGAIICKNVLSCTLKICALYYALYLNSFFKNVCKVLLWFYFLELIHIFMTQGQVRNYVSKFEQWMSLIGEIMVNF